MNLFITVSFFFIYQLSFASNIEDCKKFKASLPAEYKQGHVKVPRDYSRPQGEKIEVFYYTKIKDGQTPVAFFNGGPSFPNHDFNYFSDIEKRFNIGIIFIDQRGTGCSGEMVQVTDRDSAKLASLNTSDNIVRDSEAVRKKLLGQNRKWVVFGQSYGGMIVERYVIMAPKSLISAHNYAGVLFEKTSDEFVEMLTSQKNMLDQLIKYFPDAKLKIEAINAKLNDDKCLNIYNDKLCGRAILALVGRQNLNSESQWGNFVYELDNIYECKNAPCLFNSDSSLNQAYMDQFIKNNELFVDFWWGSKGTISVTALFRQELGFENWKVPNHAEECRLAEKKLLQIGVVVERDLLMSECDILKQAYGRDSNKTLFSIFSDVKIRAPFKESDLKNSLQNNPQLKYFIYNGDLDMVFSNPNLAQKRSHYGHNLILKRFSGRGHWGYLDEPAVWSDISGKNLKSMIGEKASYEFNGQKFEISEVGRLGGMKDIQSIAGYKAEIVFVGKAITELDPTTAAAVKGKIALVERGQASFLDKAKNVFKAGATGLILVNNSAFPDRPFNASLGGTEIIDIPGLIISKSQGEKLKQLLQSGAVVVTFDYD